MASRRTSTAVSGPTQASWCRAIRQRTRASGSDSVSPPSRWRRARCQVRAAASGRPPSARTSPICSPSAARWRGSWRASPSGVCAGCSRAPRLPAGRPPREGDPRAEVLGGFDDGERGLPGGAPQGQGIRDPRVEGLLDEAAPGEGTRGLAQRERVGHLLCGLQIAEARVEGGEAGPRGVRAHPRRAARAPPPRRIQQVARGVQVSPHPRLLAGGRGRRLRVEPRAARGPPAPGGPPTRSTTPRSGLPGRAPGRGGRPTRRGRASGSGECIAQQRWGPRTWPASTAGATIPGLRSECRRTWPHHHPIDSPTRRAGASRAAPPPPRSRRPPSRT